jgi:hypothetical protein
VPVFDRLKGAATALSPTAGGRDRCHLAGCRRRDGMPCSYVDKRGRSCPTAWCAEHTVPVGGLPFCRRHASTLIALDGAEAIAGLPDLDNRAPSLVGWMGRELDGPIRDLLRRVAPNDSAAVITDPVRLLLTPGGGPRRWAKAWKVLDDRWVVNRVSVEVDEHDDSEVSARVDADLIGKGVPPWIEHRRAGVAVDAATDANERRQFTAAMARSIELVVTRQEVATRP